MADQQTKPKTASLLDQSLTELSELIAKLNNRIDETYPNGAGDSAGDGEIGKSLGRKQEMEKLQSNLEQINSALKQLKEFEEKFPERFQDRREDIDGLLQALLEPSSTDQLSDELVEKRLREINKQVRKLKHRIPISAAASSQSKASTDHRSHSEAEAESSTAKMVEELLDLEKSQDFVGQRIYTELFQEFYNKLDENERKCLLCLAVFAENEEVKKRMLSYWWEAEGFLSSFDEKTTIKEKAERVMGKFVEGGLVEPVYKKRWSEVKRYRMKAVYRSAVVKLAQEKEFFVFDCYGKLAAKYSEKKEDGLVKKENNESGLRPNWLREKWEEVDKIETIFNANEKFPDLKMMSLAKKKDYTAIEWLLKMNSLRVLYLGSWRASTRKHHIEVDNKTNFLEGLKNMNSLRLFSLQGISGISSLTKFISGLTGLEILDLKSCHNLEEIPQEINFLKNLTHLDISNCFLIDHMPKGLSSLTKLQVLKGFVLADYRSQTVKFCTLEDLRRMACLMKLSIVVGNGDFPTETDLSALRDLTGLRILSVLWGADSTRKNSPEVPNKMMKYLEFLSCYPCCGKKNENGDSRGENSTEYLGLPEILEKLDLVCYPRTTSPPWLSPKLLKSLQRLYIRGGKFRGDLNSHGNWESVRSLRLKYLAGIKMSWEEMRSLFPNLTYLEKVDCPMITLCPCDVDGVWKIEDDKKHD